MSDIIETAKMWMDLKETADYIGVKESTVYSWISKGRSNIPYHKLPGSHLLRFKKTEIDNWISSGKKETQEEYLNRIAQDRSG